MECLNCHESCSTCKGPNRTDCLECSTNYTALPAPLGSIICKTCEEINVGYYTALNGTCQGKFLIHTIEICGDDINLKMRECDDGNEKDGDGCSSDCRVEEGFVCQSYEGRADVCTDVRAPSAILSIKKENTLAIRFNKTVKAGMNSTLLAQSISVLIKGTERNCDLHWEFQDIFPAGHEFEKLIIRAYPKCHLQGSPQTYIIAFNNVSAITSASGMAMADSRLRVSVLKYAYTSKSEAAFLNSVGESFSSVSWTTLILALGVSAFQNVAIQSLWDFINMLQMLSYLAIISCRIPFNLELFLTEHLEAKNVVVPLNFLPEFASAPLQVFGAFLTNPFNDKFLNCGHQSISFIFNFSDEIVTWVLLLLFYVVLKVVCFCLPKSQYFSYHFSFSFLHKLKNDYGSSMIIRIVIECYLNMVFCAFLNISSILIYGKAELDDEYQAISFAFTCVALVSFNSIIVRIYCVLVEVFLLGRAWERLPEVW